MQRTLADLVAGTLGTPGPTPIGWNERSRAPSSLICTRTMAKTLYMVIEHFKGGDAIPVYRRFRDRGRLAPAGLSYVSSWVDKGFGRCSPQQRLPKQSVLAYRA